MNKRQKNELEIRRLAEIEDKFKALGKFIYACWIDNEPHNFGMIMREFNRSLKELE